MSPLITKSLASGLVLTRCNVIMQARHSTGYLMIHIDVTKFVVTWTPEGVIGLPQL